jgi:hypothetical protein
MKRAIEVSEIRKGDLIRWEGPGDEAHEWREDSIESPYNGHGQHYLLDRPEPVVELPTEPTLGWLTASQCVGTALVPVGVPVLDKWSAPMGNASSIRRNGDTCGIAQEWVTAFEPATIVPTEALDVLRLQVVSGHGSYAATFYATRAFLREIDKAATS